jgi:hypothetical protein
MPLGEKHAEEKYFVYRALHLCSAHILAMETACALVLGWIAVHVGQS